MNDLIHDGFNSKKNFKFEQYNKLIKMSKKGKKHYNPIELVHGSAYIQKKKTIRKIMEAREQLR